MFEKIEQINNKREFIEFLNQLSKDYQTNYDLWENGTIDTFIEQIASWIEDYSTCPMNDIDWTEIDYKILAKIFYMGKIYE